MGRALYRKYRPKNLGEVIGQKHITDTLERAIKSGKISHAYLLTGPRGTGKTSIARILAHELNGIEYNDEQAQLDIIEIDAASNRRIDEIRDLRDKVHILPTSNKYKVYIIDEVHMLTREAFNALLKTLEEPPEHVVFILATTEAHKLPETIISRTQHYSFKPVDLPKVIEHLGNIAKGEKLEIEADALKLIARHGEGSFRDSISLLDQARGLSDNVTLQDVERLLGIAPADATNALIQAVNDGNVNEVLENLSNLRSQGYLSGILAKQLGQQLRADLINNPDYQNPQTLHLLGDLINVSVSPQPDRALEIALLDYIFAGQPDAEPKPVSQPVKAEPAKSVDPKPEPKVDEKPEPVIEVPTPKPTPKAKPAEKANETEKPQSDKTPAKAAPADGDFSLEAWPLVVAAIKKKYNTLYGILRMAEPSLDEAGLVLSFKFAFHQKQINNDKNRRIISDTIKDQTGQDISITCVVAKKGDGPVKDTKNNIVNNVSDIFGGAEVLES